MPRRQKSAPQVVVPTTSLVASARRYAGESARIYRPVQDWQTECYRHYAICGEVRFAARFFGHALARATLHAATIKSDGTIEKVTTGEGHDVLGALFNGKDGQAQMLEAVGIHLTIAGECFLIGRTAKDEDSGQTQEIWEILSVLEVKVNGKRWSISQGDGTQDIPLTDDDVAIRIWNPNPARRIEADSPLRSMLPILDEIEWLTKHIFSQLTSRLAGNGVLFLPDNMTFPPPPEIDGKRQEYDNNATAFMLTLADGMLTPLQNPGSPSAKVPIVVTAPADAIDKARWMTFWSELDSEAKGMRQDAIQRFALGMDLPPEQVTGMSSNSGTGGGNSNGVSHWGAWQIEEATIKMHIEPMLELVVNALTVGYTRPLTDDFTDIIIYNTSALRLRPDRSKEAIELYDRGLISLDTMLREVGFNPEDKMEQEEFKFWLLKKIASGSATPEQVGAAARALGVDIPMETGPTPEPTRETRPDPSLEDHPDKPRTPDAALLAASEALVFRALERAGNRLRAKGAQPPNIPSFETHVHVKANGNADYLLTDAWTCAPQVLEGLAAAESVVPVLESYCNTLFVEQSPHSRTRLREWLALSGVTS